MHVERTESRMLQHRHRQHAAVEEGKDEVGLDLGDLALERRGFRVGEHLQPPFARKVVEARVPARLVRVVDMRDHERHLDACFEQCPKPADAYVPVAEDDRLGSQVDSFSSTAWMRYRGRWRTCW